jgi:hypothetical protein
MGVEVRFQAIPEDCELLKRARQDRELAELTQFFDGTDTPLYETRTKSVEIYFINAVKELFTQRPGLVDRYLYAGGRKFDQIIYLLSPAARTEDSKSDHSLIKKAIMGSERLHPEAQATQGRPIGFVPASNVQIIAEFLNSVTFEQFHKHYDPVKMFEMGVYKMHPNDDEEQFKYIWAEFEDIRNIYQAAATHGEAMITVID